ncbi:MYND-type domain-containing protein [Mycena chlorophos]|uniref:MYND-type domain-containing protein n=1 Tax=Mycena chlorophos TaxID=658473 RepID=A0A8H6TNM7_MYCCL|nr:MYND-type domain-containing protein [Mycena chlorophos]
MTSAMAPNALVELETASAVVPPSLRPEALSKLPSKLKRLLEAAREGASGSLTSLGRALDQPNTSQYALPVLFELLDPVRIDDFQLLHDPSRQLSQIGTTINLLSLTLDKSTSHDMTILHAFWIRTWQWIEFIDGVYWYLEMPREQKIYLDSIIVEFLQIMAQRLSIHFGYGVFHRTAGLYRILGRIWKNLLPPKTSERVPLKHISKLIAFLCSSCERSQCPTEPLFRDLVLGLGGTWTHFARALVSYLRLLFPDGRASVTGETFEELSLFCSLLRESVANDALSDLRFALATCGLTAPLVHACRALLRVSGDLTFGLGILRIKLLRNLHDHLDTPRRQERVVEALQAGVLFLFFRGHAEISRDAEVLEALRSLLQRVLQEGLVYYSVLSQLRQSLAELAHLQHPVAALRAYWETFVKVAQDKFVIMSSYDEGKLNKFRACDNIRCGAVKIKSKMYCCSGCRTAHYCSPHCQKADYRDGDHRTNCATLAARHKALSADISRKDRAFLRAMLLVSRRPGYAGPVTLLSEYLYHQEDICRGWLNTHISIKQWHQRRGQQSPAPAQACIPYTIFDLSTADLSGGGTTRTFPPQELIPEFSPEIERRRRAPGSDWKMEMHVLILPGRLPGTKRHLLMPLRSSKALIYDALFALSTSVAMGFEPGDDELCRERVRRILEVALPQIRQTY